MISLELVHYTTSALPGVVVVFPPCHSTRINTRSSIDSLFHSLFHVQNRIKPINVYLTWRRRTREREVTAMFTKELTAKVCALC